MRLAFYNSASELQDVSVEKFKLMKQNMGGRGL